MNQLEQGLLGNHPIYHPVLQAQTRRPIPMPFSTEGFITEAYLVVSLLTAEETFKEGIRRLLIHVGKE